jgi:hypothetical protein
MRDWKLTRRLLFTTGSGVLGVTVLNTVTGCSSQSGPPATSGAPSPRSAAPSGRLSAGPGGTGDWRRVDLSFVSAYLLIRGAEAAVVDLDTAGSAGAIESALKGAGSTPTTRPRRTRRSASWRHSTSERSFPATVTR